MVSVCKINFGEQCFATNCQQREKRPIIEGVGSMVGVIYGSAMGTNSAKNLQMSINNAGGTNDKNLTKAIKSTVRNSAIGSAVVWGAAGFAVGWLINKGLEYYNGLEKQKKSAMPAVDLNQKIEITNSEASKVVSDKAVDVQKEKDEVKKA